MFHLYLIVRYYTFLAKNASSEEPYQRKVLINQWKKLNKLSLYIVEDDPIQRFVLEKMAENLGLHVFGSADNAPEAVREILRHKPDLILVDIQLRNETNGIDVAKTILDSFQPAIIFITANSDLKIETQLSNLSSHYFIQKPVSYYDFQNILAKIEQK